MKYLVSDLLVYQMSCCVDLTKSQFKVIFIIQDINEVSIERMNILK